MAPLWMWTDRQVVGVSGPAARALAVALTASVLAALSLQAGLAAGERGIVATGHPLATRAGIEAMKHGGNALDAVVAAALTLGVVDGHNSGIGGGCFILLRRPGGETVAVDGRETAPAKSSRDMFLVQGRADPKRSQTGALAAGVPGALAAYEHVVNRYGKLQLRRHLLAAASVADEGFPIDASYANRLKETAKELAQFPAAAAIFLDSERKPFPAGTVLRQPDLGATYRAIGRDGIGWFYHGAFAKSTEAWMSAHGGLLCASDFASYKVEIREPLRTTYRQWEIIGFPPPSSGGVHVAQILNILEALPGRLDGLEAASRIHVTAEAMKLAFADRAHWLGDPAFTQVPRGLVAKRYAATLAREIRMEAAASVRHHGDPPKMRPEHFGRHTTHFTAADAEGMWVACTATLNTSFGSKVVVPGTGVLLNNQMDDFSAQPGVTNYFGLVGGEANAVVPGKRPLSSMSPTIILRDGLPVLSVGAAGGPTIITQTVLAIVGVLDLGMDLSAALAQTRFHHQWLPDVLVLEKAVHPSVVGDLERRGHKVSFEKSIGATQAIGIGADGKTLVGASDPRGDGQALGWRAEQPMN